VVAVCEGAGAGLAVADAAVGSGCTGVGVMLGRVAVGAVVDDSADETAKPGMLK